MTNFNLLAILACGLCLGLSACSGGGGAGGAGTDGGVGPGGGDGGTDGGTDGGGSPDPSESPLQQARTLLEQARDAVDEAQRLLDAAQTPEEVADATLRLGAARADFTGATARVDLETARAELEEAETLSQSASAAEAQSAALFMLASAETQARSASTPEERRAVLDKLERVESLLATAVEGADAAVRAAAAARQAEDVDLASDAAMRVAADVEARARSLLEQIRTFQASANSRIRTLRRPYSITVALGPAAAAPGSSPGVGSAAIQRFPRANSDGTANAEADRLTIAQEAVPYSEGKRVISLDSPGMTDELPLREVTVRMGTTTASEVKIQGRDGTGNDYSKYDGVPVASIQLDANRIVYKYGGEGVVFHDNQRHFDIGDSIDAWMDLGADQRSGTSDDNNCWLEDLSKCSAWNSYDLQITWTGIPESAPNGERVYYWNSRVPLPEGQNAGQSNLLNYYSKDRTDWDLGLYELWLTNYGGIDRGLEDSAGKGRRFHPQDDTERFLSYAAYGLFVHTDPLADVATSALPSRVQGFHFGYDAFEDAADKRTTDVSKPVNLTFRGRTMALMHQTQDNKNPLRVDLRADITLNARIGSGANTISGEFGNFEKLGPEGDWVTFDEALRIRLTGAGDPESEKHHRLVMASRDYILVNDAWPDDYSAYGATINADGSYEGGLFHQWRDRGASQWKTHSWAFDSSASWTTWCHDDGDDNGCYDDYPTTFDASPATLSGTLYGPRDDLSKLETAGYWYLPPDTRLKRWGGIVGSFGATQKPADE